MLILISPPDNVPGEVPFLIRLFEMDLEYFHLRKPGQEAVDLAAYLKQIPSAYHGRIVLHSHFPLLEDFNLKGIHLGFGQKVAARSIDCGHKSVSCHALAELETLDGGYDYAFLSPVFDSISKQGYHSGFSLKDLHCFFAGTSLTSSVIALGGITPWNLPDVMASGFAGAALLGSVWQTFTEAGTERAFETFLAAQAIHSSCQLRRPVL